MIMMAEHANSSLGLFDSIALSVIGMLIVFIELILLALFILLISKIVTRLKNLTSHSLPPVPCNEKPLPPPLQMSTANLTSVSVMRTAGLDGCCSVALLSCISKFSGIPLDDIIIKSIEKQ